LRASRLVFIGNRCSSPAAWARQIDRTGHRAQAGRLRWQQRLGNAPELALRSGLRQIAFKRQQPRQHSSHVAIQNRNTLSMTERCNRSRRGGANSRQRLQHLGGVRKHPRVLGHHHLSAAVQVARPAVITKTAPQRHHVVWQCLCKRLHIGKAVEEAGEIGQHRAHLRLLQHDF
jgi:hypothetical protein